MEGLFILMFIGIVFFNIIKSNKKTAALGTHSKKNKTGAEHQVPEVLKAKWAKQEQQKRNSKIQQAQSRANASQTVWNTARNASENIQRQSQRAQTRNQAQRAAFAENGKGQPIDKNPNRRNDWGKQGHFKGGWTQPFLISIISAAALAGLFVVT